MNKWGYLLAACLLAACGGENGGGGGGTGGSAPCADVDDDGVCDENDRCAGDDTADADDDGVCDANDRCAGDDGADADGDGVCDAEDLCQGDDHADADNDDVCDAEDVCPAGDDALDSDNDLIPNACDVCTGDDDLDADADGVPDACDVCPGGDDVADADGDTVPDHCDVCAAGDDRTDTDGDDLADACDNCAELANPDQADTDGIAAVAIAYAPEASPDQTIEIVSGGTDDGSGALLDLGFEFELFGETFTQFAATTNGFLTLGAAGHESEYWPQPIPVPGEWNEDRQINAVIAAAWTDLDITNTGAMTWALRGEAPNRRLVVEWKDLSFHSGANDVAAVSAQVILFEGTNAIEIHTDQQAWPSEEDDWWAITRGVESADGTIAAFLPGEAYSSAPLGRTAVRYTTAAQADGIGDLCAARCSGDEDADGVCDVYDTCEGHDIWDEDRDGVPDDCDLCLGDDATGDDDGDGFCADLDVCQGGDDSSDEDGDGTPNACDLCPGVADYADDDLDGQPDACDLCVGDNATGDTDADGTCDSQDVCEGDDAAIGCGRLPFRGQGAKDLWFGCTDGDVMIGLQSRLDASGDPQGAYVVCRGANGHVYAHGEMGGQSGEPVAAARCDDGEAQDAYVVGQRVFVDGHVRGFGVICRDPDTDRSWSEHIGNTGDDFVDACDGEGETGAGAWLQMEGDRILGFGLVCG